MFRFGRRYSEPNKNGRVYPGLSQEEFFRAFQDVADRITIAGRYNLANFVVVSARFFESIKDKDKFKFGR